MNENVIEKVQEILKTFGEKYITSTGDFIISKIREDLENLDEMLISKLLEDSQLKLDFTKKAAGTTLFDGKKLGEMLSYETYWQGSYTKYANKIGLTSGGKYLDENLDVVLDFPYKDAVLTANMSQESEKLKELRDEPFLNEIVAKSEIDVLLDKKVLVNAKRYDKQHLDGRQATDFDENIDNLIVKGNNLLALHTLKEKYTGKVKLIYLDVPYYFKKKIAEDSFKYNSNFHLSTWLVFLKNRFEVAKELLAPKGSIWINISEDGMHYLKVLADTIFDKDKFVGTIPRKTRNGKSDVPFNLSQDFDWLLVYTNGEEKDEIVGRSVERKYYETPDFPGRPWRKADLTKQTTIKERPNSNFTMINPRTGKEYPVNPKRSWAVTKDTFQSWYENGGIGFPDDYEFMSGVQPFRRVFKAEDDANEKLSAVYSDFLVSGVTNDLGNDQIDELFGRDEFNYAKPEELLKEIIAITTKENDLVLDFFMGSATTQAVAMKMNRRFIGIEQMDYINTVSIERLKKVIEGEQGGISKNVNWKGGGSFVYAELMEKNTGFIREIASAENTAQLQEIYDRMQAHGDIDFRVNDHLLSEDLASLKDELGETLKFAEIQKLLIRVIDKNQLYYNYSEIADSAVREMITDDEAEFNQSFYSGKCYG